MSLLGHMLERTREKKKPEFYMGICCTKKCAGKKKDGGEWVGEWVGQWWID